MATNCPSDPWPEGYTPFQPRPWLSNGHLQTIFGNFLPRPNRLPASVAQLVEVSPAHGTQISKEGEVYVYFKHEDEPTGALNALAMLHRAAELAAPKARAR